jgi:membrane protease YdiL (CAAX protease family)
VLYPVLEELAFRGWLQGWLWQYAYGRRQVGPVSLANLTTSTLFAGFHLLHQPPVWALAVMPPSLVFGFFRDRYQRLMPSIILHIFYNSGFIWLFAWPP